MKKLPSLICFFLVLFTACTNIDLQEKTKSYFFDKPATIWEESIPLGNGRIGMMPDGGIAKERILLNEISLWSGSKQETDNPQASWYLPRIRQLLFEGRNDEAQELMYNTFVCKGEGSALGNGANAQYGSYQLLGYLNINYNHPDNSVLQETYQRRLNLNTAISSIQYKQGGVNYTREAFTSFASDLGVVYLTADVSKILNFTISMDRPEHYAVSVEGNDLVMQGQLNNGTDGNGMKYRSRVRVILPKGGDLSAIDSTVSIKNASEAILLVSMCTDYYESDIETKTLSLLDQAARKSYAEMKKEHIEAYQRLYKRADLDLGSNVRDDLPIDQRLAAFAKEGNDPALAALYFQFGRYLLISSTRENSLPPNLQGLWANTINTPWNGDYHLNINLQMNLWPAEITNLSELHRPMIDWTLKQIPSGESTARSFYNAKGWVTHILGNVWEFTAPGEHPSWGATNTSAAWLCQHLYQHYLYTKDKTYLERIYPALKGASLFFVDMLVQDPRSKYLVTAPTTSPENAYRMPSGQVVHVCAGSTMDNQIIRELFTNTIEAASILNIDSAFSSVLHSKRSRLMPTTIAADGRIMEWLEPFEETEPTHRHVSHLYGLYPGDEITVENTPDLAEAAKKTLLTRGDQSTGWSMAWKMNFWARLHDGDHAYKLLSDLLKPCITEGETEAKKGGTFPNLFCAHPPFQIDGNFGGCAGIAEMLIQSHTGRIKFLPALPSAWQEGSFYGLKVRDGGEVSARWSEGKLIEAGLKATVPARFIIEIPENSPELSIQINKKPASLPVVDGVITLEMQAGDSLLLKL
ncbi:glycoside hydrolase family 95 protein [Massilibacteroides sp.]|uniref:glycoside hydrolase family 95 protein n=1 Tax=Massilibacteroides sp. TaxID=2034766 RepID=UPI00262BCC64|nr:glycoside hydrolase family 95 protein [Massilibacteroides sp.]MDD4516541.1 glycoside hydrolase family 95 protein [Massilibacteroides sp.]